VTKKVHYGSRRTAVFPSGMKMNPQTNSGLKIGQKEKNQESKKNSNKNFAILIR
jgi:hypothetical protein